MKPARPGFEIEYIHADPPPIRNEVAWYRWEFLRRNPEYRADHQKFIKRFGTWLKRRLFWYDVESRECWTESDKQHYRNEILPILGALCEKWKVTMLVPPGWQFDPKTGMRKVGRYMVEIPTIIAPGWEWDPATFKTLRTLGFLGTGDLATRYQGVVLAEFDLNWPMKDLLGYAKRVLAYARENYEKESRQRGVKIPSGRRRIQEYAQYLEIWDLKQEGKKPGDLAKLLFPNEDLEGALQKVRDRLKAAQRLVSGHPQEIR
jgi:hypothetical protein